MLARGNPIARSIAISPSRSPTDSDTIAAISRNATAALIVPRITENWLK